MSCYNLKNSVLLLHLALETASSCRHRAPLTGTTSAAKHRTDTFACMVRLLLGEGGGEC